MAQVIKFFGWLLLGIAGTLIVFGHLAQGFVYGWKYLATQLTNDPATSALSLLAFVPGLLLYGCGVLLDIWGRRSDAKWTAHEAARNPHQSAPQSDQAES